MDTIGNNIANVNTYGFKKARAAFRDQFYQTMTSASEAGVVYGGGNPSQVGYGAWMASVDVNFGTGSGAPTGYGMDAMIAGNGFFLVGTYNAQGLDRVSNSRDVTGSQYGDLTRLNLTRVGIFNIDGQGNLVDSMSNFVYGFLYQSPLANLQDDPADPMLPGTLNDYTDRLEMLRVPQILMHANGDPVLDPVGNFIRLPYVMTADGNYETDEEDQKVLLGVDRETGVVDLTFLEDYLEEMHGITDIEAYFGENPEGFYSATMKLNNISIGADGLVRGSNDLGEVVNIGIIAIANVPNPNALIFTGNGYYKAEANTGVVTGEKPGEGSTGRLNAGYLEMANVDLAQEFTDMIITQRGFQANGRIITVTDEMLAELVNLKR